MQLALSLAVLVAVVAAECDLTGVTESERPLISRICALESEVLVLENAVQELLQRADLTLANDEPSAPQKRKNEFIRFGKRSIAAEKRKNEFIRFGKRKNEFIRFGRSDPALSSELGAMEKRKNEFIRFG